MLNAFIRRVSCNVQYAHVLKYSRKKSFLVLRKEYCVLLKWHCFLRVIAFAKICEKVVNETLHPLRIFYDIRNLSLWNNSCLRRPRKTKRFLNSYIKYCPLFLVPHSLFYLVSALTAIMSLNKDLLTWLNLSHDLFNSIFCKYTVNVQHNV